LFERALQVTKEYVFVSLPNEENIHLRLDFMFGRGLLSHGLEMHGKHTNHRHLWFIQKNKAKKILTKIADDYGFTLEIEVNTISYPNKFYKRFIYKALTVFMPWSLKARNFGLLYKKKI
jgi:hypothetical protein